ncbi:MAG: DUF4198 domain-containing protein [Deltaproteobacteria bacterium]|jgi:uncharacterized GH25 family protein|nr:DUF4198 domain-containing protein [Deltaproteobacteria bacterium]
MKSKLSVLCLSVLAIGFSAQASAHDFWAEAVKPKANQKLSALIGYGHNYPVGEEIPAEEISTRFLPPKVTGDGGELTLEQGKAPREFLTADNLPVGNYVVTIETPGGFSTRTSDGWTRKPKNESPGAKSCSNYFRYGKEAIVLGGAKYSGLAAKPVGQELEFVPQADPSKIKAGQPFPVKVIYKGQPLRGGEVSAYLAGMVKDNAALFFQAATDQDGQVNIIPLKSGDWLAKVSVEEPYQNKSVCDTINYTASYTFRVDN